MKNEEKIIQIYSFLETKNSVSDIKISKTGSLYFYVENENFDGKFKISNHIIIEDNDNKKRTRILKASEVENYKLIVNGFDPNNNGYNYEFATLDKYFYEYGESKTASDYWIPVSKNWSVKKLINKLNEILGEK